MSDETPRYHPYDHPAGGWGAAGATARVLMQQSVLTKGSRALLSMNQPGGFKCPSCAFPDPIPTGTLEFCENGAKALAFEATSKQVTRDFFDRHTVTELMAQSDHWLEMQGRLTEPMRYEAASDKYLPVSWSDAFALWTAPTEVVQQLGYGDRTFWRTRRWLESERSLRTLC